MKKLFLRAIALQITFVLLSIFTLNENKTLAGTSYAKELSATTVYENQFDAALEIFGFELPFSISVSGGTNAIGTNFNCSWAFATCDNSKVRFEPM